MTSPQVGNSHRDLQVPDQSTRRSRGALPESCSRLEPLFCGALFAIDDWSCNGQDTSGTADEWAREDRVVVARRGLFELTVDGATQVVDPLSAALWHGHSHYRVRHPVGGGDECTLFRLTEAGCRELRAVHRHTGSGRVFPRRSRVLGGSEYLSHRVALDRARNGSDPLGVEEPALAFLLAMVSGEAAPTAVSITTSARAMVDATHQLISQHYLRRLSLAGIAAVVGGSPSHLSRCFHAVMGTTVHQALIRRRLAAGLEQLLDTPDRVAMVALSVGFASHSHFCDAFRAEYGCPPSQARRLVSGRVHQVRG